MRAVQDLRTRERKLPPFGQVAARRKLKLKPLVGR